LIIWRRLRWVPGEAGVGGPNGGLGGDTGVRVLKGWSGGRLKGPIIWGWGPNGRRQNSMFGANFPAGKKLGFGFWFQTSAATNEGADPGGHPFFSRGDASPNYRRSLS